MEGRIDRLWHIGDVGHHSAGPESRTEGASALWEACEIDLDAEISHYLDALVGQPAGAIVLRQRPSHTSGYSTVQGSALPTDDTSGTDELARRIDDPAGIDPASLTNIWPPTMPGVG